MPQNAKLAAIFCSLASASLFSFTHVIAKFVSSDLSATLVAFWNDIFALLTVLVLSFHLGGFKKTFSTVYKIPHLLRAFCLTMGYLLLIISLSKMTIATAYSFFFLAPILGIILSALLLKEKINIHHIISLVLGFGGVLVILRPGLIELNSDIFFAIFAALFFSGAMIFGRKIPPTETKLSFAIFPILMTLFVTGLLVAPDFQIPSVHSLGLLACSGFMAGFAVMLAGMAYSKASAAIVAPFEYVQMVWGVLFGYLIFKDTLELFPAIGALLIIASGLYLIHKENKG